ncbi:MAG: transcriptional regulator, GntR family [Acidimicrobiaceae bacterium]|jgi:DNA-binding GntR family transcriptional regulator|nr:transcriptional regulator, GntR family [Acidimicrobiaceae bacterium]
MPVDSVESVDQGVTPLPQHMPLAAIAEAFHLTFKSAEELAQAFVREAIMRGVYRPGDRLPQDEIANILGISRIPVRAGLRLLEAEGLVTIYPHRGARVNILQAAEIKELYELRAMLECFLLEESIPHLTPERIAELQVLAARIEDTSATSDSVAIRRAFYERLYTLADRPRVLALVTKLHGEVGRYLLVRRVSEDPSGHFGLLRYIEKRDVAGAKTWLVRHLAEVSEELQAFVSDMHSDPVPSPNISN